MARIYAKHLSYGLSVVDSLNDFTGVIRASGWCGRQLADQAAKTAKVVAPAHGTLRMCSSRSHSAVGPWVRYTVDANAFVHELQYEGVIEGGDLNTNPDARQQNLYLHACLVQKCTVGALRRVCGIIIAVKGNCKMKVLGEEMKNMLGGTQVLRACIIHNS